MGCSTVLLAVTIPSLLLVLSFLFVISRLLRENARLKKIAKKYELEEGSDQCAQHFKRGDLIAATQGFSADELLGASGFGSVYRGRLLLKGAHKPTDVAVKRIPALPHHGAQEILKEVKMIGQVRHRNLVRLLGWCHEKCELLLVYDFMPNGSVDQHLFKNADASGEPTVLTWARRLKIVSGVATALAYLHEERGGRIIHRDVKSSNVMIDHDFNARLGDFGLARFPKRQCKSAQQAPPSTVSLGGTYGYLAPEIAPTLKATEKSDVYSFGAMVLEVATGRGPILSAEDKSKLNESLLVDWVWGLHRDGTLLEAPDWRLQKAFDPGEMVMFLKIGLLCCHPDPLQRPPMREVLNIWKGSSPLPQVPPSKPAPVFSVSFNAFQTSVRIFPDDCVSSEEFRQPPLAVQSNRSRCTLMTALKYDSTQSIPPPPETLEGRTDGSPMPTIRSRSSRTSLPL